jgi:alpha-methylacyl-CoA racemase
VIDAAMVEGAALLATPFFGYVQNGSWSTERGTNIVDSGAPFYDVYETSDGGWLSVAAMEPQFYAALLSVLGLDEDPDLPDQHDHAAWPAMKERFAAVIATRTRDEWCAAAADVDACVAPVLGPDEVEQDPHNAARATFVRRDGLLQPAPAPRFSRTPAALGLRPPLPGEHTTEALADWGLDPDRVAALREAGAIAENARVAA